MNNNEDFNYDLDSQHMTLGNWLITMLLLIIPIVNIVLMFVWAFGSNVNKSKKTFCQAQLIITGILIVLMIIFGATIFAALGSM
ncbi:MAG: hypothetical protein ACRC68_00805 [Clostridium sp.]